MATQTTRHTKPRQYAPHRPALLLVEGTDDFHVVLALCKAHADTLPDTFGILECQGTHSLLQLHFRSLLQDPSKTHLGVILDANQSGVPNRYRAISQVIQNSIHGTSYTLPPRLPTAGLVLPGAPPTRPHIGIWVMPDNHHHGALEDFLLPAIKPRGAEQFIQHTLTEAHRHQFATYQPTQEKKARLHTYLAWQDTPGLPLGLGITSQAFDLDNPTLKKFITWLKQLYFSL